MSMTWWAQVAISDMTSWTDSETMECTKSSSSRWKPSRVAAIMGSMLWASSAQFIFAEDSIRRHSRLSSCKERSQRATSRM